MESEAKLSVDAFLDFLYEEIGEPMPAHHDELIPEMKPHQPLSTREVLRLWKVGKMTFMTPQTVVDEEMADSALHTDPLECAMPGNHTRFLHPQTEKDLYQHYCGTCGTAPASLSTFHRVFKDLGSEGWSGEIHMEGRNS